MSSSSSPFLLLAVLLLSLDSNVRYGHGLISTTRTRLCRLRPKSSLVAVLVIQPTQTTASLQLRGTDELNATSPRNIHNGAADVDALSSSSRSCCAWTNRVRQLQDFQQRYGHTRVPKRYPENQPLANWVSKQRQLFRLQHLAKGGDGGGGTAKDYQHSNPLTKERIEILNQLGFCWYAGHTTKAPGTSYATGHAGGGVAVVLETDSAIRNTSAWWSRWQELKDLMDIHRYRCHPHSSADLHNNEDSNYHDGESNPTTQTAAQLIIKGSQQTIIIDDIVAPKSGLTDWLYQQRVAYERIQQQQQQHPQEQAHLSEHQIQALAALDRNWWMGRRQQQWERHFRELEQYIRSEGHACVPISHSNSQLANWVSNQRKQYNRRQRGLPSSMTTDRLARLERMGFVWNRWEYEFSKQRSLTK